MGPEPMPCGIWEHPEGLPCWLKEMGSTFLWIKNRNRLRYIKMFGKRGRFCIKTREFIRMCWRSTFFVKRPQEMSIGMLWRPERFLIIRAKEA